MSGVIPTGFWGRVGFWVFVGWWMWIAVLAVRAWDRCKRLTGNNGEGT